VILADGCGVSGRHLRLWWRDGRLMLHHLDRSATTTVNGQIAEWVALEPGDRIRVGDYELSYVAPDGPRSVGVDGSHQPVHSDF
jgi:predicted component of type VI protein secretion system